jgi:phosphoribosylformylglycinamidine (FGAM) synthase-like amidotransferase family enzyme
MHSRENNLMPHPERACEPLLGSADGRWVFESMITAVEGKPAVKVA